MSDKGFIEWLKDQPIPDTLPGVESLAQRAWQQGAGPKHPRIRELEEQLAERDHLIDRMTGHQKFYSHLTDALAEVESLREQLAARDAVIERVVAARGEHPACNLYAIDGPGGCGWKRAVNSIDAALTAAPESVLAEVKADAWAEGVTAYGLRVAQELLKLLPQKIDMTNPYRKGAGQ